MSYVAINNSGTNPIFKNEQVLGIGLSFNSAGVFSPIYLSYKQAKENLKNLLLTMRGERIENIEFGCDLMQIIFEPTTDDLKVEIEEIIINAVSQWLPEIDITDIEIKTILDDPNLINVIEISISFSIQGAPEEQLNIEISNIGVVQIS